MATLFYDHLIDWPKLYNELDAAGIDGEERLEIVEHIEHELHTEVLIVFVEHLPAEKHTEFLERFHAAPYDEAHLQFVITHGKGNVEEAVRQRTNKVINEILVDLTPA